MKCSSNVRMRGFAVIAAVLYLTLSQSSYAQDRNSPETGGPGGSAFVARCAPGEYLVGLSGRAGNWVDAIAIVCGKWNSDQGTFAATRTGAQRGGTGGNPRTFLCDDHSVVVSLLTEVAQNEFHSVGLITPRCANALAPDKRTKPTKGDRFGTSFVEHLPSDPNVGTSREPYYDVSSMPHCGADQVAVGIIGSAGNMLDRIGLICSPKPFIKPSPITQKSGPSARADQMLRCKNGYYPRLAGPDDSVCVTFQSRAQAAYENAHAAERVNPKGAYGPKSCVSGFVWRKAFDADFVCVTPERRTAVGRENDLAESRRK